MTTQRREFTLRGYLQAIRRQRLLIIGVAIVCALLAFGISAIEKAKYTATSSLSVNDPNQSLALAGSSYPSSQTPLQLASTAAMQVTRPEVLDGVKRKLKRPWSTSQLSSAVAVAVDPNSYAVQITATSDRATTAAAIANAFASVDARLTTQEARAQYHGDAAALSRQLGGRPGGSAQGLSTAESLSRLQSLSAVATPLAITSQASVPSSPSSPKTVRNVVAGLLIGLLLGIAIGTGRDVLDRRLRHSADVSQIIDHPVVGHIRAEALGHAGPAAGTQTNGRPLDSADEESFRILRHNVRYLAAATDTSTVLVTSAMAEEGKSTVAAGLAAATAQAGKRTLLVECDLRKPTLAKQLGIKAVPGLTDYLTGNAEREEIFHPIRSRFDRRNGFLNGSDADGAEHPNLVCITAGTNVPRPAEMLASERFQAFLAEVGQDDVTVIIDSAPLLPVADTLGIVPYASTVLVCLRLSRTTRDQARAAQTALSRLPARPVGLVLTSVGRGEDGCYHDGSYYGARTPAAV